jgi:sigma-B regulation protein RsbU (phosphoserine phosphatase)
MATDALLGLPNAENAQFTNNHVDWQPGDSLVLYSDGITEARNVEDEEFGDDRLAAILRGCAKASPRQIMDSILEAVSRHCGRKNQDDDITVVVARAS